MQRKSAATVDLDPFRQYVAHCDLSEAEKTELLEDLWSIIQSFVDEAWGTCPTQHIANDNQQQKATDKELKLLDYLDANNSQETTAR